MAATGRVVPIRAAVADDPRGRLDILLERFGELLVRRAERGLSGYGIKADLWGGSDGVQVAIQRFCQEQGIAGMNMLSPTHIAERAGLLKRRKGSRR